MKIGALWLGVICALFLLGAECWAYMKHAGFGQPPNAVDATVTGKFRLLDPVEMERGQPKVYYVVEYRYKSPSSGKELHDQKSIGYWAWKKYSEGSHMRITLDKNRESAAPYMPDYISLVAGTLLFLLCGVLLYRKVG